MIGILLLILNVALPLFFPTDYKTIAEHRLDTSEVLGGGLSERLDTFYLITKSGSLELRSKDGELISKSSLIADAQLTKVTARSPEFYAIETSDNRILHVKITVKSPENKELHPEIRSEIVSSFNHSTEETLISSNHSTTNTVIMTKNQQSQLTFYITTKDDTEDGGLFSDYDEDEDDTSLEFQTIPSEKFIELNEALSLTLANTGNSLAYLGPNNHLTVYRLNSNEFSPLNSSNDNFESPISAMGFLQGDVTLITAHKSQEILGWSNIGGSLKIVKKIDTSPHSLIRLRFSPRNKMIFGSTTKGDLVAYYYTSSRFIISIPNIAKEYFQISPRGDGILSIFDSGVKITKISAPHPEINFKTLFKQIWYEGYSEADYVWQSSGGSDDFEPKLSLIPLIFGTFKATFYAMLFAVPIALLGAIYLNQFVSARFRALMKSTIELMAALPSVVIGFLAALWIAPTLQNNLLGFFTSIITAIFGCLIFIGLFSLVRHLDYMKKVERGYEFLVLIPIIIGSTFIGLEIADYLQMQVFSADFNQWIFDHWQLRVDQRNSIVIAIALGFAVMPIILSISEDSFSGVPPTLMSSSLALGASRWQTAWKVLLPSASPGIFAAIMIGFGRAIGETMIVLMATGNTPIMDTSIFNGMRTLAANIAVEVPEAPVGGTLYRTLFLCATVLFILTFIVNTLAETVRTRLRNRYGKF